MCRDEGRLSLADPNGRSVTVQARSLDRWPDGTIRWVLLDFLADLESAGSSLEYELSAADRDLGETAPRGIGTVTRDDAVTVDTGVAVFALRAGGRLPFEQVTVRNSAAIDSRRTGLEIQLDAGPPSPVTVRVVNVEERGPLRAVVRVDGSVKSASGDRVLDVVARLHFVAQSATVRFDVTLRNPRRAVHPGGFWELGDPGSLLIRDASFHVALPGGTAPASVHCSPETGSPLGEFAGSVVVHQGSSGADNWNSSNHVDRGGSVPLRLRGYRLQHGDQTQTGSQATPIVSLRSDACELSIAMSQFWQNFPKVMAGGSNALRLGLFPAEHGTLHELQGGAQKTHVFHVAFDRDAVRELPLDCTRTPMVAMTSPDHYCSARAISYLIPSSDARDGYERLVNLAIDGDQSFERKRGVIDEYGWRNFGDIYADHEAVFDKGSRPLVSHYNNQYDAVAGLARQFMRSGDVRWWHLFVDLASHVVDIDLYHTDEDKAAYNHGLFWHTAHYVDAGRSTHRAFPHAKGVGGGGPSPEHNYSSGLLLHYWLTGNPFSRDGVLELADWVIAMDDGRRTPFRWLARGPSGIASATVVPDYHGPGRGAGNSINALVDGHRVSGEAKYLRKAEELIRRCIHPEDDIASRDLLDAEQWWSYTVFLHVLGRYLDYQGERGETGEMYAYARASLLAYVRWMAEHERPYLDHPERLEFPTETWVAQEMWKSEVFDFAAGYADGAERARFLERAQFFHRYAVTTLSTMETRACSRPLVLLLSHGFMRGYAERHPEVISCKARPSAADTFARPSTFVAQKTRAKHRLVQIAGIAGLLAVGLGLLLFR